MLHKIKKHKVCPVVF